MTEKSEQQKKQVNDWLKYQKKYAHGKLSRAIALGSLNGLLMIIQTAMLAYLIDLVIFPSEDLSLTNSLSNNVTTEGTLFFRDHPNKHGISRRYFLSCGIRVF